MSPSPLDLHYHPMDLPYDVKESIVAHLADDAEALHVISTVSKEFSTCARRLLFRVVTVMDVSRLRQLIELLSSAQRTLPDYISTLTVDLRAADFETIPQSFQVSHADDIIFLLSLFEVSHTLSLNVPWMLTRFMTSTMIWDHVVRYSSLRSLVLGGIYPRLDQAIEALGHIPSLERLVVNATWRADVVPSGGHFPSSLKSLSLSAPSLALLTWMSNLAPFPEHLSVVRLIIDGSPYRAHLRRLRRFMSLCGPNLKHLCLWLEEVPERVYESELFTSESGGREPLTRTEDRNRKRCAGHPISYPFLHVLSFNICDG